MLCQAYRMQYRQYLILKMDMDGWMDVLPLDIIASVDNTSLMFII